MTERAVIGLTIGRTYMPWLSKDFRVCQILQITLSRDVRSWPMQQISVLLSETIHSMNIDVVRSGVHDGIVHNGVVNEIFHRGVANDECSQFALLQRGSRGGFLVKAA